MPLLNSFYAVDEQFTGASLTSSLQNFHIPFTAPFYCRYVISGRLFAEKKGDALCKKYGTLRFARPWV
jgi:hypothetical protein